MRADSAEKIIVVMDFKGEAIKHGNTGFPAILKALHFFDPERRMFDVLHKKPYLLFENILYMRRQLLKVLFKGFSADYPHALRSARNSSTVEKDFIFPAAMSSSASFSAFSQSKALKYGGSDRAYFISSTTAVLSSPMCVRFLKSAISLNTSSGISRVILWLAFTYNLLSLLKIIINAQGAAMETPIWA